MESNRSNFSPVYNHLPDDYNYPEPEEDNCTPATWAYLEGKIEFEQARIIDIDDLAIPGPLIHVFRKGVQRILLHFDHANLLIERLE